MMHCTKRKTYIIFWYTQLNMFAEYLSCNPSSVAIAIHCRRIEGKRIRRRHPLEDCTRLTPTGGYSSRRYLACINSWDGDEISPRIHYLDFVGVEDVVDRRDRILRCVYCGDLQQLHLNFCSSLNHCPPVNSMFM